MVAAFRNNATITLKNVDAITVDKEKITVLFKSGKEVSIKFKSEKTARETFAILNERLGAKPILTEEQ